MNNVPWNHPELDSIQSMRFEQSPSNKLIDVVSCEGRMKNGMPVKVELPFRQLPKSDWHGAMLDYGRRDNVSLKGLGIFNGAVITILWKRSA